MITMELYNTLKHSGLTKNESKIYLALIRLGSVKAGQISKETDFNRTTTYECLKSLGSKGLVSYVIIGKIKYFQASNPKNLEMYMQDKLDNIKSILPELEKQYKSTKLKDNVRLFKGNKGVKTVLNDIIENAKENYVFGSEGQLEERLPEYAKKFVAILEKKKVQVRSIVRSGRNTKETKNKKNKYIDMDVESPVVTNIFNDKIAIIVWSEIPEVILIENEKAAKSYKEFFEFMWKNSKTNSK